jgi:hypothetical protein
MKLLDDYLDGFPARLSELTRPGLRGVTLPAQVDELGLVCPDVRAAIADLQRRYADMCLFLVGEGSPTGFREHGAEVAFTTRVAFGHYRGVMLELAEPGVGSTLFGEALDPGGRVTIHHLGFYSRERTLTRSEPGAAAPTAYGPALQAAGLSPRVNAFIQAFGVVTTVAIYDASQELDVSLEFLDFRLFSQDGWYVGIPQGVFGVVGWLQRALGIPFIRLSPRHQLPPPPDAALP